MQQDSDKSKKGKIGRNQLDKNRFESSGDDSAAGLSHWSTHSPGIMVKHLSDLRFPSTQARNCSGCPSSALHDMNPHSMHLWAGFKRKREVSGVERISVAWGPGFQQGCFEAGFVPVEATEM